MWFLVGTVGIAGAGWAACSLRASGPSAPTVASASASTSAVAERPLGAMPMLKGAHWSARLVVQRLRGASQLTDPLLMAEPFQTLFEDFRAACGVNPLETIDDAALSGGEDSVAALRMAKEKRESLLECARAHGEELVVDGQKATLLKGARLVVATKDDLLLVGGRPAVAAILRGEGEPAPAAPDDLLVAFASGGTTNVTRWEASVRRSPLRAESRVMAVDATLAGEFEKEVVGVGFADLLSHGVKGSEWTVGWTASQPARAVGAFGILGASLYLRAEKAALARASVTDLAGRLVKETEKAKKCPASAPKVPAVVPRGTLMPLSVGQFLAPTWAIIGPPLQRTTHYQYAIDTSVDGRRCTVSAVGDLDADEVDARFSIEVVVDGGKVTQMPMVITEELE